MSNVNPIHLHGGLMIAVRLSQVFGGTAESWITQQAYYDLARVRREKIKLKRLEVA